MIEAVAAVVVVLLYMMGFRVVFVICMLCGCWWGLTSALEFSEKRQSLLHHEPEFRSGKGLTICVFLKMFVVGDV